MHQKGQLPADDSLWYIPRSASMTISSQKKKCKGSKKQNKKKLSQKILKEKSKLSQGHFRPFGLAV
jgi:hypothetical protein